MCSGDFELDNALDAITMDTSTDLSKPRVSWVFTGVSFSFDIILVLTRFDMGVLLKFSTQI